MQRSALVGLLAAGGALLAAMWWWRQPVGLPDQPLTLPDTQSITSSPVDASGIDPAALRIRAWHTLSEFPHDLAQFETVFWEPEDTASLRQWLASYDQLPGARVLEIGTGTGIIALWCVQHGARAVVATDINPQAVANARYNADLMGWRENIEVRLVSSERPGPFAVIDASERFDLIVSNPPWEDAVVEEIAAFALYDPGFQLLDALLKDSAQFLRPGGKLLLAYGAQTPIMRILTTAPELGWHVTVHDERDLTTLPEVFVPGVLLELERN